MMAVKINPAAGPKTNRFLRDKDFNSAPSIREGPKPIL